MLFARSTRPFRLKTKVVYELTVLEWINWEDNFHSRLGSQIVIGLLVGGTNTKGSQGNYANLGDDYSPTALVHSVNVVKWLGQHFRTCDLAVIKMDVKGAEHDIIPALVRSGAHRLVDILAWGCHEKGGSSSYLRKLLRQTRIIVLEEGRDYDGWR